MALVDQLTEHRRYLASVLERQECRRRVVNAGRYAAQPALGVQPAGPARHGHGSTAAPLEATAQAGPSREGGVLSPNRTGRPSPPPSPSKRNVANYIAAEEAVRNDYAAWYGVSGDWPSNYVLGAGSDEICEEFPTLRRLMELKRNAVDASAHAPLVLPLPRPSPSLLQQSLSPHRFDVILIHPGQWRDTAALPIRKLSADPGFVFLWVGAADSEGLERGRECLANWGFRRAEDIVWVKTNKRAGDNPGGASSGIFASQKEHCLMGIRGTVRRSTDSHFVHCNVDTDVIVWEEEEGGPRFPPDLYTLIENFCLGARRLEIFGNAGEARRGWVTATVAPGAREGQNLHPSSASSRLSPVPPPTLASLGASEDTVLFDSATYSTLLPQKEEGKPVVPFSAEIDALRPKSPQRRQGRRNDTRQQPSNYGRSGQPHGGHMAMGGNMGQGYNKGMPGMNAGMEQPWGMMPGMGQGVPNMAMMQGMYPQMAQMAQMSQLGQMGGLGMPMGGMMMPGMLNADMMAQMQQLQLAQMMAMQPQAAFNQAGGYQQLAPGGMPPNMQQGFNSNLSPNLQQGQSPSMPQGLSPNIPQGLSPNLHPGHLSPNPGLSPNPSHGSHGSSSPRLQQQRQEEEWLLQQQQQQQQQMGQLALGMGAMGMPYLGGQYYGQGYGYNG